MNIWTLEEVFEEKSRSCLTLNGWKVHELVLLRHHINDVFVYKLHKYLPGYKPEVLHADLSDCIYRIHDVNAINIFAGQRVIHGVGLQYTVRMYTSPAEIRDMKGRTLNL